MRKLKILGVILLVQTGLLAQGLSDYIVVDQFGYLPASRKVAVIRNPIVGYDADQSFAPGKWYALVDALTGELVYRAGLSSWMDGKLDASSGDEAWHFDFSSISRPGT